MNGDSLHGTLDVDALAADMLRFAELLQLVARPGPELGRRYAAAAMSLQADQSPGTVGEVLEWISLTLRHTGNNSVFDRYVSLDGEIDDALSAEYLRLATKLRQLGAQQVPAVPAAAPSEELIPAVPNMFLRIPLIFVPIIAMVLTGIAMDNSDGPVQNVWALLFMLLLVLEVVAFVFLFKTGLSAKRKLAGASERIADTLLQGHGITMDRPKMLIVNNGKPRLTPYELRAIDASNRPIYVSISTDETGTKVVPASVRLVPESELL